jgi:hypothetical protein
MRWKNFGWTCCCFAAALSWTVSANAASSLTNSLAGFTGDSTQAGTLGDLATAGLSVYSTSGLVQQNNNNGTPDDPNDDFLETVSNHTITYDASGAHFGALLSGDGGRNYMRTIESDYATVKFTAEVTFTASTNDQAVYFGIGAGDTALFGTPDWSTQFSSASFWPEVNNAKFVRFRTANDVNAFGDTGVPGLTTGTHRFRMTFNPENNQLLGAIDVNYAGGPFVADAMTTNFPIVLTSLFAADGWPSEPSRIFFGGDDGATFRDLSITVVPEPASAVLLLLGLAGIVRTRGGRRV